MTPAARRAFDLADAELTTLWREGGRIRFRAGGPLSAELAGALRDHRADVLEALTAYPRRRREPGADSPLATEQAEAILATLPQPLRDHERDRWCADLASAWAKGIDGRTAARQALAALTKRIERHAAQGQSGGKEPRADPRISAGAGARTRGETRNAARRR